MKYILDFNKICVLFYFSVLKNGAPNVVASARMKFASEARLRLVLLFGSTEPTCMPLSGHFMDIEVWVLVYQTEIYQLTNEVCIRS